MGNKKELSDVFRASSIAEDLKAKLDDPIHIQGAQAFYNHQKVINQEVASGHKVAVWSTKGKDDVVLMAERYGRPLAQAAGLELQESRMQYPKEFFDQAREGKIALEMTRERHESVFMINKQDVFDNIDPVASQEREMEGLIKDIQDYMEDNGISPQEMRQAIRKLKEKGSDPDDKPDNAPS